MKYMDNRTMVKVEAEAVVHCRSRSLKLTANRSKKTTIARLPASKVDPRAKAKPKAKEKGSIPKAKASPKAKGSNPRAKARARVAEKARQKK